jgi:hypothetical protein
MAKSVVKRIRHFSGKVSRRAVKDMKGPLVLEHYERMQTKLTDLVAAHHKKKTTSPQAFISLVQKLERVHIVTRSENYAARRARGNYREAGISLVRWTAIPTKRRKQLWNAMLRGRVCNAEGFSVK